MQAVTRVKAEAGLENVNAGADLAQNKGKPMLVSEYERIRLTSPAGVVAMACMQR